MTEKATFLSKSQAQWFFPVLCMEAGSDKGLTSKLLVFLPFPGLSALVCYSCRGVLQSTAVVSKVGNKAWVEVIIQQPFSCPEGTSFGLTLCQLDTCSAVVCLVLQISIQKSLLLPRSATVKTNTFVSDLTMTTQTKKQCISPVCLQVKQVVRKISVAQ